MILPHIVKYKKKTCNVFSIFKLKPVAIIGKRRVGKSSLIDALRSLSADDEGSAKKETSVFNSPVYPLMNVEKHLNLLLYEIGHYNDIVFSEKEETTSPALCVFVVNEELDLQWMSDQCKCRPERAIIVRSKMNTAVENDAQEHPKTHNRDNFLTTVRNNINAELEKSNLSHLEVYLIDSYYSDRYDFKKLEEYLAQDFDTKQTVCFCLYDCFIACTTWERT